MTLNFIDPTDPKYQIKGSNGEPQFKPNKEDLWNHAREKSGWTVAHNALRMELTMFRQAFEAMHDRKDTFESWHIEVIQSAMAGHLEHVHAHHRHEDVLLVPVLKKRFDYPQQLETDHGALEQKFDLIEEIVANLQVGGSIDQLLKHWLEYEAMMLPHLKHEEEVALPLCRAYFTPEEIKVIVDEMIRRAPASDIGSFIHVLGPETFRKEFMVQEGIPGFVWYIDFQFKHRAFLRDFAGKLESLKLGKQPAPVAAPLSPWFKAAVVVPPLLLIALGVLFPRVISRSH